MSIYSSLVVLALAALVFVGAIEEKQPDNPPSGLRRGKVAENTQRELQSCPCSCDNPYTGARAAEIEAAQSGGVLVQIIPIPGSPPEYTQICLTEATANPVMAFFPFAVWCVAEPCPSN